MFVRLVILFCAVCTVAAIPRGSQRAELQKLVRLPMLQFSAPLEFHRHAGFVVFPDAAEFERQAVKALKGLRRSPSEAQNYLEAARLYEQGGNVSSALRVASLAATLFRKQTELNPTDGKAHAGLGAALSMMGRFVEAGSVLQQALALAPEEPECLLALSWHHQERAWEALIPDDKFSHSTAGPIEVLENLAKSAEVAPAALEQSREFLSEAAFALEKAGTFKETAEFFRQRAAFRSLQSAMEEVYLRIQHHRSVSAGELWQKLFVPGVIADRKRAAALSQEPADIAVAAMLEFFDLKRLSNEALAPPSSAREALNTLQELTDSNDGQRGPAAAEMLGAMQFFLFEDYSGAVRSFERALTMEPRSPRAWDLLLLSATRAKLNGKVVDICSERARLLPSARARVLLSKAYFMNGEITRAEVAALAAVTDGPNDFLANLTLAAFLLRREDFESFSWKIQECLTKAERNTGLEPSYQNKVDLAFTRALYHALTGEQEKARAAFRELPAGAAAAREAQELSRLLDL